ncbi:HlyD family efflux transporter periplasmic adaptor subunit [Chitinophaga oryziterrae]|uniref:HlyD family efflux transporter periplasmic adaptor subunit n=1 Tax=Chitinophaga oryziterrae TaxID=1031224 RepID=A0A6N8JHC8_9BACT|nr:HlyD family efflux transporter periplasmic adaptor subunit [Chitinophaga oryziterrae]MVT44374.1 HlyD family efflux transporter periplasmic adaptor subunit [Chitinophaga oryziterrae]
MPQFIDHHSGEIQDIIGRIPSWVARRGTTVIACLVLLLLLGAWLIRYPDVVRLPLTLSPSVNIIAQSNGRVTAIKNNQLVKEQEIVGIIDNPAKTADIQYLQQLVTRIDTSTYLPQINCPDNLQAGMLQGDYKGLLRAIHDSRNVIEAAQKLKSGIAVWEKQYVLKAPVSGKLLYVKSSPVVTAGEPVFVILPEIQTDEITLKLPLQNADRVKVGQSVIIKLRQYPFMEYGMLQANVENISSFALDSNYIVQLKLKNGFVSTKNKILEQRPGSTGTADIITSDKSILQRIFNGIYGPLER